MRLRTYRDPDGKYDGKEPVNESCESSHQTRKRGSLLGKVIGVETKADNSKTPTDSAQTERTKTYGGVQKTWTVAINIAPGAANHARKTGGLS